MEPIACQGAVNTQTLRRAARLGALVRQRLDEGATPDALWAAASLDLITAPDNQETVARVVRRLEEVVSRDPSAGNLNDLAVAYLVRGSLRQAGADVIRAYELIVRSLVADSTLESAHFNRGLILERLYLVGQSVEAWQQAARTAAVGWSTEAKDRATALDSIQQLPSSRSLLEGTGPGRASLELVSRIATRNAEAVRNHVMEVHLPRWAAALLAGRAQEAADWLEAAREAAQVLARHHQDSVSLAAVEAISGASAPTRARSARAVDALSQGAAAWRSNQFQAALPRLAEAMAEFRSLHRVAPGGAAGWTVLHSWAGLLAAMVWLYSSEYRRADSAHHDIARTSPAPGSAALLGQALWGLGISYLRQGNIPASVAAYEGAAEALQSANDRIAVGMVRAQVASAYQNIGLQDLGLRNALAGQRVLLRERHSGALELGLLELGASLQETGSLETAVAVHREALLVTMRIGAPIGVAEALARLAEVEAAAGHGVEAKRHLAAALEALPGVSDPLMHRRLAVAMGETSAALIGARQPDSALTLLSEAVREYDELGVFLKVPALRQAMARHQLALGDTISAFRGLEAAIRLLEDRLKGADPRSRSALLATRASLYRNIVSLALGRGETAEAFRYAEQARPFGGSSRAMSLGRGAPVLAYTVLPDRVLTWQVDEGMALHQSRVDDTTLTRMVARFENLIRSGEDPDAAGALSETLYALLVAPARPSLGTRDELVIVPDGVLQRLPFAALQDPRTGRRLIEDFTIRYAPAVRRSSPPPRSPRTPGEALVIDASTFARSLFPSLPPLSADRELASLRQTRPSAVVLRGSEAGKERLLRTMPAHPVIIFVGHARSVEGNPEQSHLVLGNGGGGIESSLLYGHEIQRLRLAEVGLVVLSACGTVQGSGAPIGGIGSLAQAFISAGAGAVISSIWEVDDLSTAELMADFGAQAQHHPPPMALRAAQLERLRSGDPSLGWSAFRYEER